jgi:hypothetical protein
MFCSASSTSSSSRNIDIIDIDKVVVRATRSTPAR